MKKERLKPGPKPNQKKYVYVVQDFHGNITGCFSTLNKANKFKETMNYPLWVKEFELH
jgi:hypothetical protein